MEVTCAYIWGGRTGPLDRRRGSTPNWAGRTRFRTWRRYCTVVDLSIQCSQSEALPTKKLRPLGAPQRRYWGGRIFCAHGVTAGYIWYIVAPSLVAGGGWQPPENSPLNASSEFTSNHISSLAAKYLSPQTSQSVAHPTHAQLRTQKIQLGR
jgi:hypothetical protein